jgi:curved DNA-binding protein
MEFKDYYAIMGLDPNVSQDEIKRTYRKLARKYHPDVSKDPQAEAKFKELGEAYEVLKDPQKRASYDKLRSQGWRAGESFSAPPNWGFETDFQGGGFTQHEGFSDFFEALFGGRGFSRVWRGPPPTARGEDIQTTIVIELEDAYLGTTKTIELVHPVLDNSGKITQEKRTLRLKIPEGVKDKQQIRLKGQGGPGRGAGPSGDLYVTIRIRPHRLYEVENRDIILTLPISPWEAALGIKVETPTLGGKIELKIPPNSQTGKKLRVKGKGLPGTPPGDQYIVLQIVTPPAYEETEKNMYGEMAQQFSSFNPRKKLEGE